MGGWVASCLVWVDLALSEGALAQSIVVPDDTLGTETSLVLPDPDGLPIDIIEGGATRGENLFHSFQEFNIGEGQGVYFANPAGIATILSRVTGQTPSDILGTLGVLGEADLFLINPNGIVFGENARLDVRGSFVATTANAIEFSNQGFFSLDSNPSDLPLLTVNPSALLFNQIIPQPIINRSTAGSSGLTVDNGRSLLLVGGDVSLDGGRLTASGGRVELGGVSEAGTVGLIADSGALSLAFPADVRRADVELTNGADVNVAAGGGGSVAFNARNIDTLEGSNIRAGISNLTRTTGAQAGDVTLNATDTVRIENSAVYNAVFGAGSGGNLQIDARQLVIQDGVAATATLVQGQAGNLIINASEFVELIGIKGTVRTAVPLNFGLRTFDVPVPLPIGLFSASLDMQDIPDVPVRLIDLLQSLNFLRSGGDAGDLTIKTRQLVVRDGAVISAGTLTEGRAGALRVFATDSVDLSGTSPPSVPSVRFFDVNGRIPSGLLNGTRGNGSGGDLMIETGRLTIRNGASVFAPTTTSAQPGGQIEVVAKESVELEGTSSDGIPSLLATGTLGAGNARPLTITTRRLTVRDGAFISAATTDSGQGGNVNVNASDSVELAGTSASLVPASFLEQLGVPRGARFSFREDLPFPSGIITGAAGNGNAGDLTIHTARLSIRNGAQASVSTSGAGDAGDLTVRAAVVELNSAQITTQSQGQGAAGNLSILQADSIRLDNQAKFSAETASGNGGNITLQVRDLLLLRRNSSIFTTAGRDGAGGNGGNITINNNAPNGFLVAAPRENSDITANAFEGRGGRVEIEAQGILGFVSRSSEELSRLLGTNDPSQLDPARLPTNDITAISQTNPALSGEVIIDTPETDPTAETIELPAVLTGTEVAQGCRIDDDQPQNTFVVTGRGGVPPVPEEAIDSRDIDVGLVTLNSAEDEGRIESNDAVSLENRLFPTTPRTPLPAARETSSSVVEAQGWTRNEQGTVQLLANASAVTADSLGLQSHNCQAGLTNSSAPARFSEGETTSSPLN